MRKKDTLYTYIKKSIEIKNSYLHELIDRQMNIYEEIIYFPVF